MASPVDAVLLIAFGGPTRPDEIRPFLANVAHGRAIPPARLEEVAHHYERIGGRSPLNELTVRQARALEIELQRSGVPLPVFVGMRNWHPYLRDTLAAMAADGRRRAIGVILSAQQTEASWDRYQENVTAARVAVGPAAPEICYADPWHDHPLFIEAAVDRAATALHQVPDSLRPAAHLLFTAHSVPVTMAAGSPYVGQIEAASRQVAERLGHGRWSIAYQSRSGNPREPWLEPDVGDVIRDLARTGVHDLIVVPIGFVSDHVEVLYDLDVEASGIAEELGVRMVRAPAMNDHPTFIRMLADVVRRKCLR